MSTPCSTALCNFGPMSFCWTSASRARLNALDACRLLQATTPQVSIVAFTADNDPELRRAAYEAGASGFVWKMQVATDLLPAIQAAVDGTSRPSKDNSA